MTSQRLRVFGTTVFAEMSRLAQEHGAINLAQGFPDFEGPADILAAAHQAMLAGHNQYARSAGLPALVEAIAAQKKALYGLEYDPLSEVIVFSGATEGLMASFLGLLDPGDEVILFEPIYDSYAAGIALAGAIPHYLTLRFPDFALDREALAAAFGPKTKLLVLNTPHNPTGKVFSADELAFIADLCIKNDVRVLTDEVYEHLSYDGLPHISLASLPGMRGRTLALSSNGKTYSFTGWKIGWGTGPKDMVAAAQAAHQFIVFSSPTPLQHAVAYALQTHQQPFYAAQRAEFIERRDFLTQALAAAGLKVAVPRGAYFILADFSPVFSGDDWQFARALTEKVKVAAIPPSVFYPAHPEEGRRLVRFAFCKKMETLRAAAERLTPQALKKL